ncbi:class I SAM-dependent methyltransferase [Paraburkholderia silviterrae]|uniref:class I SAM-dependent methyltransferase n=1 Tax=Paraburkholderia silviterrae TaxID=2528715 RepID=UPI00196B153A|nr:class I SAM-dependent methyltransferase [Paraburkholderia silviterrae]
MDKPTVDTYTDAASRYAEEWRAQPAPDDMYALLGRYFVHGGVTVDIGCGAGRDVAWLDANGYPAVGYDASAGLLAQAAAHYPHLRFMAAALPELDGVSRGAFDNALCETVIMHLPVPQISVACARLVDILKPGGVLYLSWRVSDGESLRDGAGRLYASFDADIVRDGLNGATIVFDREAINASSGKRVHRIVARRN